MVCSNWRAFGLDEDVLRVVDIEDDAGAEEGFEGG